MQLQRVFKIKQTEIIYENEIVKYLNIYTDLELITSCLLLVAS